MVTELTKGLANITVDLKARVKAYLKSGANMEKLADSFRSAVDAIRKANAEVTKSGKEKLPAVVHVFRLFEPSIPATDKKDGKGRYLYLFNAEYNRLRHLYYMVMTEEERRAKADADREKREAAKLAAKQKAAESPQGTDAAVQFVGATASALIAVTVAAFLDHGWDAASVVVSTYQSEQANSLADVFRQKYAEAIDTEVARRDAAKKAVNS